MASEATGLAEEEKLRELREREDEVAATEELEEGEISAEDLPDGSSAPELEDKGDKLPHPLEHAWTFWFDSPSTKSRNSAWGTSIRPIYTFQTVEDFWSLYNNINHPSKLIVGTDFNCFKDKIEPKWEDPVCENGGKWTIICQRGKSDIIWLHTLLAMIGEQFHYGDEICGAVVNVRAKQEKISLWTKNSSNEVAQMSIGRQWKELLEHKDPIGFISHDDAKVHATKNKYTV